MRIGKGTYTHPVNGLLYKKILISECTVGVYLRWWYNGWHYFNFTNGYEITMTTESKGMQVTNMFSRISKIERDTKITSDYSYHITLQGISAADIPGFTGLLLAEQVEQYEGIILPSEITYTYSWREVKVTRGSHIIREETSPAYILDFEITRRERPGTSSVFQKALKLYLDDTLCDMDDDEVVPVNKQTNDIAEMQDRQADYTAQFKIRRTRTMQLLFERSGDVGANTDFPYKNQSCRLIQDGIEMITDGKMILDKTDDLYYYVSIYSGNVSFFKELGNLKISDLTPSGSPDSLEHTWDIDTQALHSVSPEMDYVYPLCEPSDDSGMNPMLLAGNTTELYGGWIWPFVRVSVLWNELFANMGYTNEGNILNDDTFNRLYLPITSLDVNKELTNKYLYSMDWTAGGGQVVFAPTRLGQFLFQGINLINGDTNFKLGYYTAPFSGTYKFSVRILLRIYQPGVTVEVRKNGVPQGDMNLISGGGFGNPQWIYDYELSGVATGDLITIIVPAETYFYWFWGVTEISEPKISYGNFVSPRDYLPDITQVNFIKMICNMFGLIPEPVTRDRVIKFWNFSELYDNIGDARDWSKYLSERDDETEFKFGDYAQYNYLAYKDIDDVSKGSGKGLMIVDDETLALQKDTLKLDISTCNEVVIAFTNPVNTSKIPFNKWYDDAGLYKAADSIDPRIVYIKEATGKELILWDAVDVNGVPTGNHVHIPDPLMATSIDISFSTLIYYYGSLSRMLTKTNLRRAKFNLPVYEVAGLKHYIPIYLSQYKAYFYVNKINNYVPGQLCTIDLIKL